MGNDTEAQIEEFITRSRELTGKEVRERGPWNNEASADAIRHFAYGVDDDNPLWVDPAYAANSPHKKLLAPPAFLVSVLYPILHGAPMVAPLSSLIGGVEFEWFRPVVEGDKLRASSIQKEMFEKTNKAGRRLIFVIGEFTYWNGDDEVVAKATGTMIRTLQEGANLLFDREITFYGEAAMEEIEAEYTAEKRRGAEARYWEDVSAGDEIPSVLRGPLTIGDMVAWNAALGPSYKAGRLGYLDIRKAPHNAVIAPKIGIPVKNSQQHEDFTLAAGRGMPGPFDNGVMRFAWSTPFITNWMGDDGFLKRHNCLVRKPMIYGDTIRYTGKVSEKGDGGSVTIEFTGTNQIGETASTGSAEVILPTKG
ncbi:MAG: MaoC family dehydratase N-terminal domain-containing protein [bacterium]